MDLIFNLVSFVLPFAISFWVFSDASRNGITKKADGKFPNFTPGGWATLCLFFHILGFLVYILSRKSRRTASPVAPGQRGARLYSIGFVVMIGISGLLVWVNMELMDRLPTCQTPDVYLSVSDQVQKTTGEKWTIHTPEETAYDKGAKRSCRMKLSSAGGRQMMVLFDVAWKNRDDGTYAVTIRDGQSPVAVAAAPVAVQPPPVAAMASTPPSMQIAEPSLTDKIRKVSSIRKFRRKAAPVQAASPAETSPDPGRYGREYAKSEERIVHQSDQGIMVAHDREIVPLEREPIREGRTLINTGRFRESIQLLDKAIEANPRDHMAYRLRGNAYDNLGNRERAIADWKAAAGLGDQIIQSYLRHLEITW